MLTHELLGLLRSYASDWRQFCAWAQRYGLQTMPASPAVCALYLTSLCRHGLTVATVRRRAAAIRARTATPDTCRRPRTPVADHPRGHQSVKTTSIYLATDEDRQEAIVARREHADVPTLDVDRVAA